MPDEAESAVPRAGKNNAPVAKNDVNGKDRVIVGEDETAKGNVLSNDTDKNGDTLKVHKPKTLEGEFGTLKLSANGKWTYTLDEDNPDVAVLELGDKLFDTFKYTVKDDRGAKDTATLKIKIEGSDSGLPEASIQLDAVTPDNIVNATEAAGTVNITGSVGGDVKDGDIVKVSVNGIDYEGAVASGLFSIAVAGVQLSVDTTVEASVTTGTAGNTVTAGTSRTYAVDTTPPAATISVSDVTADNILNTSEAGGNVTISGSVGGDVKAGDTVTLTINGVEYTGSVAAGKFSIGVAGSDLVADSDKVIDASVTTSDGAQNSATASDTQTYGVDTTPPAVTLTVNSVTADNIVQRTESAVEVAVTGTATGDVKNGDVVTLVANGNSYTGIVTSNAFSILVAGADLLADTDKTIQASISVSDAAGNTGTPSIGKAYAIDLNLDLTSLAASQGFIIQGDTAEDFAGWSVSSAGDINGDGFDDVIVGAKGGDDGGSYAGEAYVVFGTASGFGTLVGDRRVIDLTSFSPSQGFIIQGDTTDDAAGMSVAGAGDINGDGFDDVIVGVPRGDDAGAQAGEAYIVFGTASGFGANVAGRQVFNLTFLTASQGFAIQGTAAGEALGYAIDGAGDVNGDGIDDLMVGAPSGNDGGDNAGETYVLFGKSSFNIVEDEYDGPVVTLQNLAPADGFIIQGDTVGDRSGTSISWAGDVNGDGFGDMIVGAYRGDDGGGDAGEAYIVYGTASGFGAIDGTGRRVVDLSTLDSTQGVIIQADVAFDNLGRSVAAAGDVNGDGYDDVILGAIGGDDGGSGAGEAYVVFGGPSMGELFAGRQLIDLGSMTGAQGFIIQGDAAMDYAGRSVSSAGDINGDGFDDLIVGADVGKAYVVFGSGSGFGAPVAGRQVIDLSTLTTAQGFIIEGDDLEDQVGHAVSAAGDVNGDGFDDLIVGAHKGDDGGSAAGEGYVVFGGAFTGNTPITFTGSSSAEMLIGGLGADTLTGGGGGDAVRSGAGNDTIGVTGTDFLKLDGGNGYDTLRMDGAADVFDFAILRNTAIESIEAIDMGVGGTQQIVLSRLDVLRISDDTSGGFTRLTIHGDSLDTVSVSDAGWTAQGTTTIGAETYDIFDNGRARLLVDSDITLAGGLVI